MPSQIRPVANFDRGAELSLIFFAPVTPRRNSGGAALEWSQKVVVGLVAAFLRLACRGLALRDGCVSDQSYRISRMDRLLECGLYLLLQPCNNNIHSATRYRNSDKCSDIFKWHYLIKFRYGLLLLMFAEPFLPVFV